MVLETFEVCDVVGVSDVVEGANVVVDEWVCVGDVIDECLWDVIEEWVWDDIEEWIWDVIDVWVWDEVGLYVVMVLENLEECDVINVEEYDE